MAGDVVTAGTAGPDVTQELPAADDITDDGSSSAAPPQAVREGEFEKLKAERDS